jgi:uncharacterized hydrophobic protein (TIGR00271 family)
MMKDSKHGKNAKTSVAEDAELAAFEHKERRLAAATLGLGRKSLSHEQRREILNQLFFEGEARMPYVKQFYSLLALAAIIATFGLMRNSTAVVIGAMLLSPLMTPILGVAASLVMGWPVRAGRVAIRLFFATLFVFGLAYLILFAFRVPTNIVIPAEIVARTNPKMAELLVGLCAGLAAAYMLVRKETVSALPGVAIKVITDWIGENSVEIVDVEVEDNLMQVYLRINLPYEALHKDLRSTMQANLNPEMTVEALQQRLIKALDKKVDITLKGHLAYWKSTCPVPADCYF